MNLRCENLGFCYKKDKKALDGVSFSVESGKILAVLGKNGQGKSTLLKCIAGVEKDFDGKIFFGDTELTKNTRKNLASRIGYVPQKPELYSGTVFEAVLFGMDAERGFLYSETQLEKVEKILDNLLIGGLFDKNVNEISGGERQKTAIARALVRNPDLLVLDEPTANLDVESELSLSKTVRSLKDGGTTVIVAMHDINLALGIADEFLFLDGGKAVCYGKREIVTPQVIERVYGVKPTVLSYGDKNAVIFG